MQISSVPSIIASCIVLVQGVSADTILLTNGEKIEGRVLREDGGNYVLEVKVSASIKDERIVPKADVKSIEEQKEDEKAFENLAALVPTPEMLGEEAYAARIDLIGAFLEKYPTSGSVPKAKELLDILNEELEVIRMGGIKLGGELIPSETYRANAYEFDAKIADKAIDGAISRRDFLTALRLFSEYEKNFSDAAGREELAARISQVLTAFGMRVDESLASFDSRMEKRDAGLASMAADDRLTTERAIADQTKRLEERFLQEKAEKLEWITPDANHKGSLEESRRQIDREISRLKSKSRNSLLETPLEEAYRLAWKRLSDGDEAEKETVLSELKGLRMPEVYMEKLREHAGMSEE